MTSPTCLCHFSTAASAMLSPIWGMTTSKAMVRSCAEEGWGFEVMVGERLEGVGRFEKHDIRAAGPDELDADRQSLGETRRHGKAGDSSQGRWNREGISQIHGQRILRLGSEWEGGTRTDGCREDIHRFEDPIEVSGNESPSPQGLQVEGVVIAFGEAESPEEDSAFDLGSQSQVPGLGNHLRQASIPGALPITHPIKAAEIAGNFAGAEQIVCVDGIPGMGKAEFPDF